MKTDDLIALLSTNLEPVDRNAVVRPLWLATVAGSIVALILTLVSLGFRPDLIVTNALIFLSIKLAFALAVVALALLYLMKLSRPGGEQKISPFLVGLPFFVIVALAAISLGSAPRSRWDSMIVGDQWLECLLSIPIIAIVPFAISISAVRKAAPTNLVRAGAFAGLVAGGVSAMAYAFHCAGDSLPFIALWYGGTIVLCTLAGAALGPRLLRW